MSIVGRVFRPNLTPPMELWSCFASKGAQHYPYIVLLSTFDYPYEPKNDCNVRLIFCNIMVVSYTASKDVRIMLAAGLLAEDCHLPSIWIVESLIPAAAVVAAPILKLCLLYLELSLPCACKVVRT